MSLKIDNVMTTILTMGFFIFLFSLHHWTPRMNYKSHTLTIKIGHKNLVYVYHLYVGWFHTALFEVNLLMTVSRKKTGNYKRQ